jgi:hypothetical protein
MSLKLEVGYGKHLREQKPIYLEERRIQPEGALGDVHVMPEQIIPPLNADIRFSGLPRLSLSKRPDLAELDEQVLPENFNWFDDGGELAKNMVKTSNQMLCGSCWAISSANLVANNHIVSRTVDWSPNLSTTYCLACYPQYQCQGGNPAKLLQDISKNGIATKACVDYSWCALNDNCNGKATHHFDETVNLSKSIPPCGCYNNEEEHYLYFIDKPVSASIGYDGLNERNFASTIKKHIYSYGPVLGGFLVYKNFMSGSFTKMNKGIYLENGVYDDGKLYFADVVGDNSNYIGGHAVQIIGWGVAHDVVVDNEGTRKSVPYWECVNSWTEKWGDRGRFRMAMYPFNKMSQFDKIITIESPNGEEGGGGIILITASERPKKTKLKQMDQSYLRKNLKRLEKSFCYVGEPSTMDCRFARGSNPGGITSFESNNKLEKGGSANHGKMWAIVLMLFIFALLGVAVYFFLHKNSAGRR